MAYDIDDLLGTSVGDMTKNEPLPEGVYHVRVVKAELKQPTVEKMAEKEKEGKEAFPYINYDYVVTGDSPEEFHGRRIFEIGTLQPGATFVNRDVLSACGFDDDVSLRDALPELPNRELLLGVTIEGVWNAERKIWEGKKGKDGKFYEARNKVTKRLPLGA
jgi:hypothetical protein